MQVSSFTTYGGQSYGLLDISFEALSAFVKENGPTPDGCLKGPGTPPVWIEFGPSVSANTAGRVRIAPGDVAEIVE